MKQRIVAFNSFLQGVIPSKFDFDTELNPYLSEGWIVKEISTASATAKGGGAVLHTMTVLLERQD